MMAQALTTPKPIIPTFSRKTIIISSSHFIPSQSFLNLLPNSTTASQQTHHHHHLHRRNVTLGLVGVVLGLSVDGGDARGAARRPPPPPPQEKKDPNMSGVAAKVLASKKRKEAMKESIAKLREKGKANQEEEQEQVRSSQ